MVSVIVGIMGILFGLLTGVVGLVLGPTAYFLGKSAVSRIDNSEGNLGGRGPAMVGWVTGVVATTVGALVTLLWFVVFLVLVSSAPA